MSRYTIALRLVFGEPVEANVVEGLAQHGARACPNFRWMSWPRRDANQRHYRDVPVTIRVKCDTPIEAMDCAGAILAAYDDAPDVIAEITSVDTTLPRRLRT